MKEATVVNRISPHLCYNDLLYHVMIDWFCITAERYRDPEPEVDHNTINNYEEQRRRQVEECCNNMVENDVRCDWTCHRSCTDCGKHMLKSVTESICEPGGRGCTDHSYARFLLLPCWYGIRLIWSDLQKAC